MRKLMSTMAVFCLGIPAVSVFADAVVQVDASAPLQVMDGFGATHISLVFGTRDNLTPGLRAKAIQAVYGDVGLNLGNVESGLVESPPDYALRRNDNGNPDSIDWAGFQLSYADNMKAKLLDPARPLGFTDFSIAQKINVRWNSPWLNTLKAADYNQYLAECAEQVAAGAIYHRDKLGVTTRYIHLFNEPLNGNTELQGSLQDMVAIIKAAGARLRKEGFADLKFVIPNSETATASLAEAKAILADPEARKYVGVIGYHCYPYGSPYASVPRILAASGTGTPDAGEIAVRAQLRALGRQYGIPLWMTEVSHSEVAYNAFDGVRGRAIHIHDEIAYAGASAFFGMNNMWDQTAQQEHFGNGDVLSDGDTFALIENDKDKVDITAIGYAVGHYARWIKKGAVLLTSVSQDKLLQVSAFLDAAGSRLVLVLINNNASPQTVDVAMQGAVLTAAPAPKGEQSTASAFWQAITPSAPDASGRWKLTLPALSVTSVSAGLSALPTLVLRPARGAPVLRMGNQGVTLDGRVLPWPYPNTFFAARAR